MTTADKLNSASTGQQGQSAPTGQTSGKPGAELLGLSTNDLAGLTVADITDNPVAVQMVLHYFKQLNAENLSLKNDVNTYRTYADAYEKKRVTSIAGGILAVISNIPISLGVNLLTGDQAAALKWSAIAMLFVGLIIAAVGLYFTLRKEG